MTKEEQQLYNELKKEIKRANQRILRLERETGLEHPFVVKQLYDYIDNFAITKKGRVGLSSKWDLTQLKVVQKAVKDFLKSEFSTIRGIKKYKNKLELEVNDTLTYKQVNTMYEAKKHWTWILDWFTPSEFFRYFVQPARDNNWDRDKWIKVLSDALHKKEGFNIADEDLKNDLIDLYNYFVRDYQG